MAVNPLVSVVVSTKNEEENLADCLESIMDQSYPADRIEILVIDNNSTDKTVKIARRYTDKVFKKSGGRSVQRNYGFYKSRGKYILWLDADMRISSNLIEQCVLKIKDNIALYLPEKIESKGLFGRIRNFERSFYFGTCIDSPRFILRSALMKIKGFDPSLYAGEDWDMDRRLSQLGKFKLIKTAYIRHDEKKSNLIKYLIKKRYYSRGLKAYVKKWGENDPVVKKQIGFKYRFWTVFVENKKYRQILRRPFLFMGVWCLKILVGFVYLCRGEN